MIKEELISVIVPIYNVEKYLDECLKSINEQTYKNLEILLINDGSKDNSIAICQEWIQKDLRMSLINKLNGGISDARNYALDRCNGEYLVLVDSDDYIEPRMIELLYSNINNKTSDLAICGYKFIYDDGNEVIPDSRLNKEEVWDSNNFWDNYFVNNTIYCVVAWNKLYRSSVFQNVRYPKGKIHEDEFVIHEIINNCKSISVIPDLLYNYRQRPNSIMSSKYDVKRLDRAEALLLRLGYFIVSKDYQNYFRTVDKIIHILDDFKINIDSTSIESKALFENYIVALKKHILGNMFVIWYYLKIKHIAFLVFGKWFFILRHKVQQ